MHKYKLFVVAVVLISVLLILLSNPVIMRFPKTLYLIAKVSPYEQVVADASTILVLGDSTGYGTGANKSKDSIAGLVGNEFPAYTIKNNSKNGRTIGELVPVVEDLADQYELVLLQIGGNDILQKRDISTVEEELRLIVSHLNQHAKQVVMMSSGNVGGAAAFSGEKADAYERLTRDFREMFLRVSNDTDLTYVDLFIEPSDDPFMQDPQTYFSIDGLHPSSAGYALWYRSLSPVLQKLLTLQNPRE